MSQHKFKTSVNDIPFLVLIGWDRPMQGFFLVVYERDEKMVYSNLLDPELVDTGGYCHYLTYFEEVIEDLGICLPVEITEAVQTDAFNNMGNKTVFYWFEQSILCQNSTGFPGTKS
jgi:hypothetical protein